MLLNKLGQIEKNKVPANRSQTIPSKNTNFPQSKYNESIGKCVIKKVRDKDTQILYYLGDRYLSLFSLYTRFTIEVVI